MNWFSQTLVRYFVRIGLMNFGSLLVRELKTRTLVQTSFDGSVVALSCSGSVFSVGGSGTSGALSCSGSVGSISSILHSSSSYILTYYITFFFIIYSNIYGAFPRVDILIAGGAPCNTARHRQGGRARLARPLPPSAARAAPTGARRPLQPTSFCPAPSKHLGKPTDGSGRELQL